MDSSVLATKFVGQVRNILSPGSSLPDGRINKVWKLQVRIPFLHSGLTDEQLPYYALLKPIHRGASAGIGEYKFPRVNSKVVVEFDGNDQRSGYVIGELQDASNLPPADFYDGSGNLLYYGSIDEFGNKTKTSLIDGSIVQDTAKNYTINIPSGSTFTINCGNSTIVMTDSKIHITSPEIIADASSDVKVNTPTATFSQAVKADSITTTTSMNVAGEEMKNHTHTYSPGGNPPAQTGTPN